MSHRGKCHDNAVQAPPLREADLGTNGSGNGIARVGTPLKSNVGTLCQARATRADAQWLHRAFAGFWETQISFGKREPIYRVLLPHKPSVLKKKMVGDKRFELLTSSM